MDRECLLLTPLELMLAGETGRIEFQVDFRSIRRNRRGEFLPEMRDNGGNATVSGTAPDERCCPLAARYGPVAQAELVAAQP